MTDKELAKYRRILGAKMEHLKKNRTVSNDNCIFNYSPDKDELFGTYEVSGMQYYLYEQKYQPLHLGEMTLFKGDEDTSVPDYIWDGHCAQVIHKIVNINRLSYDKFLFNIMKNRSNDFCIKYPTMWVEV